MTKTATKSRTALLAEALETTAKVATTLQGIDLRTTRGDLRDSIRKGRDDAQTLQVTLRAALQQDGAELRHAG